MRNPTFKFFFSPPRARPEKLWIWANGSRYILPQSSAHSTQMFILSRIHFDNHWTLLFHLPFISRRRRLPRPSSLRHVLSIKTPKPLLDISWEKLKNNLFSLEVNKFLENFLKMFHCDSFTIHFELTAKLQDLRENVLEFIDFLKENLYCLKKTRHEDCESWSRLGLLCYFQYVFDVSAKSLISLRSIMEWSRAGMLSARELLWHHCQMCDR